MGTKHILPTLGMAFALLGAGTVANAQFIAINVNAPATGNRTDFSTPVGEKFNVINSISVLSLGAFDSGQNGFVNPITASLYNATTNALLGRVTFTNASPGTLASGSAFRFQTLGAAINLTPGSYVIAAEGFGASDPFADNLTQTTNTGGGAISFGNAQYGFTPLVMPSQDAGSPNIYAAASFQYQIGFIAATPEPGSVGLSLVSGLFGAGFAVRRRRIARNSA